MLNSNLYKWKEVIKKYDNFFRTKKKTFKELLQNKKGAGLIQGLVMGIAALVIAVIIAFVIVSTLDDANLLTDNSAESNATVKSYFKLLNRSRECIQ